MASSSTFVYVSNADSHEIFVSRLDPRSGDITLIDKTGAGGMVMPLAVSPDRRFLYASLRAEPYGAAAFSIDPRSGQLKHLGVGALPDTMAYIATDRSGRFLLSASYSGSKLAVSPIDPQGIVQPAQQVVATGQNAHAVQTDPSNRFLLATCLGADIVMQQRFDPATGTISPNTPPAVRVNAKAGPRHFVFHPSARYVYLLNELDASICVFAWDGAAGTLALRHTASALPPGFSGKPWAADIHVTPDGRFLYASERTSSTLAAFSVDAATGGLAPLGSVATEQQPRGFNIDPQGRFLLAVGQVSNSLTVHGIDPTSGRLTAMRRHAMGKNPNWVEIVSLP